VEETIRPRRRSGHHQRLADHQLQWLSRLGPAGSIPQVIKQFNDSFSRWDFHDLRPTSFGRHDLKVGGEYIKNFWRLMNLPQRARATYAAQAAGGARFRPRRRRFKAIFPVWNDPDTWNFNAFSTPTSRNTSWVSAT